MEYDEDDDIFFAKWMSSFWGHNLIDEEKEGRGHKKRQPRLCSERRASLPAKLSSLHTTRLHASAKGSSSGHLRGSKEFQEDQDVKCHCHKKASRTPSADSSYPETRSNSIQEFAESFGKQLHLKSKRSVSLADGHSHAVGNFMKRQEKAGVCTVEVAVPAGLLEEEDPGELMLKHLCSCDLEPGLGAELVMPRISPFVIIIIQIWESLGREFFYYSWYFWLYYTKFSMPNCYTSSKDSDQLET
ncbi:hypothetical protein DUI87_11035 [Hirundo rustica rustica]|uniref:Leukemia NUP98 fusion partner 1 n=1 Tax=Hirundo rustica rustica TaxID=333673 RepID=A0A3M0KFC5_HIRRU|nr:hypothetical protein DUI87_11035 [Hirundo rustica rustica]